MRKKLFLTLLIIGIVFFAGCSKKEEKVAPTNNTDKYFSLSTTNITIPKGETKTFDMSVVKSVGRFDITSNNESIASVDENLVWLESVSGTANAQTITVTGNEEGNTEIVINLTDVVAFDTEESLTGSYKINVTVE